MTYGLGVYIGIAILISLRIPARVPRRDGSMYAVTPGVRVVVGLLWPIYLAFGLLGLALM